MARTVSNPRLVNRTSRIKLEPRRDPYWHLIADGQHLGYRRTDSTGTWIARIYEKETGRHFHAIGAADDFAPADGKNVLSFTEAIEAAQKWFRHHARVQNGEVATGPYTVEQAMSDYIADSEKAKRKKLPRTRTIIKAHILPSLGKTDLAKLTPGRLKAWRDSLATAAPRARTRVGKPQAYRTHDPNDPETMRKRQATANRIVTVLKAALNHAHAEDRIATKAPWEGLKPFKRVDVPKIRFLTADEVKALIPACEPTFQTLVKGALLTGCRYGELTAMRVEDFDEGQGTVFVAESKNGEARHVDLNAEGVAFFTALTKDRGGKQAIFMRTKEKPWNTSEQKRPMDAACEAAEIEGVTFHILRHTYASHAVMNGMTIGVVAKQLGHKDTRITERHYAHLAGSYRRKMVQENAPSFGF